MKALMDEIKACPTTVRRASEKPEKKE